MKWEAVTFAMIKPEAVLAGHAGKIIERILVEGFSVRAMKTKNLSLREAEVFYDMHKERPFFQELTQYISSSKVVLLCLQKKNAVLHWRNVIGATDPSEAEENTIRKLFGQSKGENAVHGSDSLDSAKQEVTFFFSGSELL